ncbi:MAG: hypothetical protein FK731_15035 [Asgard group archaeon]|nr:hypothetical protein [Asgard group archaeon]
MIRSKIRVEDFKDIEKSLLDEKWESYRKRSLIFIILTAISVFYFIAPGIMLLIYLQMKKKAYLEAKELRDLGKEKDLLTQIRHHFGTTALEAFRLEQKLYALVDLRNREVGKILYSRLKGMEYGIGQKGYLRPADLIEALDVLALKLGYSSRAGLIDSFSDSPDSAIDAQKIPITKVFFLEAPPKRTKCMVSSLQLDFTPDIIAACPYCGNMAKRDLLLEWVEENGSCPVCLRALTASDIPLVKIDK